MGRLAVAHLWVEQLRPLMIVWLLLTLPVVCHHETAVVILSAMAAGHEHQHMMAQPDGEIRAPSAAHAHGAGHAAAGAARGARPDHDLAVTAAPTAGGQAHATGVLAASGRLPAAQLASAPPLQWRTVPASPAAQGLPAADGVVFSRPLALSLPADKDAGFAVAEPAAPDPQRRAPPAPPPRNLLG